MKFIDFFAGIGGFTQGLKQAGMACAGFCENDKFALKSYMAIHNTNLEKEWFSDDITRVQSSDIPYADGWTAGFPCQDISICGEQTGLDGKRSGLFYEIIRLLQGKIENGETLPKWLFFENVKNLISINGGGDFTEILSQISELGYDCEWQVVNSKSYVPQNRERVFIIGHFRGKCTGKVFPVGGTNAKTPLQIIGGRQGNRVYCPNGLSICLTSSAGGMGGKTGLYCANKCDMTFIDLSTSPRKTDIARCIKARYDSGISNRNGELSGVLINGRVRRLTPRECFRLQGWSDFDFEKAQAVNSDSQLYKQAGNGVTVPVIREIGERLMAIYG